MTRLLEDFARGDSVDCVAALLCQQESGVSGALYAANLTADSRPMTLVGGRSGSMGTTRYPSISTLLLVMADTLGGVAPITLAAAWH